MTSERHARAGRLGAAVRWITHPTATPGVTEKAHATWLASFLNGHSCRLCPERVIPDDAPPEVRTKVAARLRKEHYRRMGEASARRRKATA